MKKKYFTINNKRVLIVYCNDLPELPNNTEALYNSDNVIVIFSSKKKDHLCLLIHELSHFLYQKTWKNPFLNHIKNLNYLVVRNEDEYLAYWTSYIIDLIGLKKIQKILDWMHNKNIDKIKNKVIINKKGILNE